MGFLRVSENGHYFVKDGAPFFWMGDTLWPAASMYSEEELEFYFSLRKEQGFNVVHIMLPWASFNGDLIITNKGTNTDELPFWLNNNPATPNEEYFKLVDMVVRIAAKHDIIIAMLPCGGGSGTFVQYKEIITAKNARAYAKWLAERYKDEPGVLWVNGFDLPPWRYDDVAYEFAAGINEVGGNQLSFYHPCGGTSSNHFHCEDWLAANFIQTWGNYEIIQDMVLADYYRRPYKPVVHVEGAYEAGIEYPTRISAGLVRRQAYTSYLSGGFHTYGHNDLWRKTPYWRDCLKTKGAASMKALKDLFASLEWWKLIPDNTLFGIGHSGAHAASISEDNDFAVLYFAHRAERLVYTGRIGGGGPVRATWIDPESGVQVSDSVIREKEFLFYSPACCDDAVLLLRQVNE